MSMLFFTFILIAIIEPVIYTNSEYGVGKTPIVYYNIQCQGWEKSISECTKTHYLHFSCSVTAGLLCPDGELSLESTTKFIFMYSM